MAEFLLGSLQVTEPASGSALVQGDELVINYDDADGSIVVYLNGVEDATDYEIGRIGKNFLFISGITTIDRGYGISGYSFCDSTTLVWFRINTFSPSYPYFEERETANSPVCDTGGGAVCRIGFVGPFTLTHCTTLTSNDGLVQATASSQDGTVKYALFDFDYATEGQSSGTITGLSPGSYTLFAKDEFGCTVVRDFTILFQPDELEHYRFTWDALNIGGGNARTSRIRIYEREYIGDLVEVSKGTTSPFVLNKPKQGSINDKFYPVHPTNAVISLMSQVDYQFLPLYTNDNKKYRVVYEVDTGSGFEAKWSGFIIPSVFREMFVAAPYPVEILVADNVESLKSEPLTDDDGNTISGDQKLIVVIAQILKKTGLQLNIRSGINVFEENHNTASTDDPLDQTYVDVACYRDSEGVPFNCYDVLAAILRPFGARIFQFENKWIIEEIDRATVSYNYREFTYEGVYSSNGTFSPIVDIKAPSEDDRIALTEQNHSMEIVPAYGEINITSVLNYVGSMVSGGFEKTDLLSPEAEVFNLNQGVFSTEEGFRNWTLRLNGVSGVSFGRVVLGVTGREGSITQRVEGDLKRSVGAFYFSPNAWNGNLRDAYIESAAMPYQYGPNDEIKLAFDFSTPATTGFEFTVLRFVLKVGSNYLQEDLTWDSAQHIFRHYPKPSNDLQKLEITAPVPDTDVVVDSTIQIRIYFSARHFFDYGLPSKTSDPADGVDGKTALKALATADIWYDYRADVREEYDVDGTTRARRLFYELRVSSAAESSPDILRPDDFDGTTNPKIWSLLSSAQDNDELSNRNRGLDVKFYVDNVAVDALINGQAPPESETISLPISKYINETYDVELYNFDLPDITNGKNMYNNYFRLSDGTPTALWARSGVDESLSLQQILLKILGMNHSAPTFRLTGSFINEFSIVGLNNYLRLTKAASALTLLNTEFTSDLSAWSQTGAGTSFTWTADNTGSAQVVLSGSDSSQKLYQTVSHSGGYITITVNVHVIPTSDNDREDVLWVVFYNGSSITHTEKMRTFAAPTSDSDYDFTYIAFTPGSVTRVGFFFANVAGTSEVTYQVGEFSPVGSAIQEIYQIADYSFDDFQHSYTLELMQLSKSYISLQGTDQGGSNQGEEGNTPGSSFSGGYSSGYGGGFDTVLN